MATPAALTAMPASMSSVRQSVRNAATPETPMAEQMPVRFEVRVGPGGSTIHKVAA